MEGWGEGVCKWNGSKSAGVFRRRRSEGGLISARYSAERGKGGDQGGDSCRGQKRVGAGWTMPLAQGDTLFKRNER